MRLFIAINLPEQIKQNIAGEFTSKIPIKYFKPVAQENLHLTLCFLGEKDDIEAEQVKKQLSEIEYNNFEITLEGIGEFNNRVIWIGIIKGRNQLEELRKIISEKLGIKNEKPHTHLTIARARKNTQEETKKIMDGLKKDFTANFTVQKISLMQSKLAQNGSAYFELWFKTLKSNDSGS